MVTVLRSVTSRLAYWTGVSPPRPFFGRSSLYSRRPAGLSERFSVPCSFARRMQDVESDTRPRALGGAFAGVSQTAVYDTG